MKIKGILPTWDSEKGQESTISLSLEDLASQLTTDQVLELGSIKCTRKEPVEIKVELPEEIGKDLRKLAYTSNTEKEEMVWRTIDQIIKYLKERNNG